MAVYVGSARIDENNKAYGGKAGDQNGKEVSRQKYYVHSKGWRVFRAKDRNAALRIAEAMEAACDNRHIGYDQWQRNDLYTYAKAVGFDVSKVTRNCETDCSALVRVCCAWAGIMDIPASFRTGGMPEILLGTGAFIELKGDGYTRSSRYLGKGDILVTRTSGHTVVVLDDGAAYSDAPATYAPGERLIKNGCEGEDVHHAAGADQPRLRLRPHGPRRGFRRRHGDGSARIPEGRRHCIRRRIRSHHPCGADGSCGQRLRNRPGQRPFRAHLGG